MFHKYQITFLDTNIPHDFYSFFQNRKAVPETQDDESKKPMWHCRAGPADVSAGPGQPVGAGQRPKQAANLRALPARVSQRQVLPGLLSHHAQRYTYSNWALPQTIVFLKG